MQPDGQRWSKRPCPQSPFTLPSPCASLLGQWQRLTSFEGPSSGLGARRCREGAARSLGAWFAGQGTWVDSASRTSHALGLPCAYDGSGRTALKAVHRLPKSAPRLLCSKRQRHSIWEMEHPPTSGQIDDCMANASRPRRLLCLRQCAQGRSNPQFMRPCRGMPG